MAAPENWGPHLWKSIHYIALGFPDKPSYSDKDDYKTFFMNLDKVIPCFKCSVNYKKHLKELPSIDAFLTSNMKLFEWTWMLHNIVNRDLGKKTMPLDAALRIYTHKVISDEEKDNAFIMKLIGGCVAVVIIIAVFMILGKYLRRV